MDETKRELIEGFSNHFETIHNFPPLTSKIYSFLLMDCKREGITFDEIVETMNASKSSISNSLTFLSQLKHVEHFTKIDHRKRFYRVTPQSILMRLKKTQGNLMQEKLISEKYYFYMYAKLEDKNHKSLVKSKIYIDHLEKVIEELAQTIEKLKQ